jgi:hypothetical protein
VRQFLARGNVPQSNENDLPLHREIRVARMIGEDHRAVPLFHRHRSDEKVIPDLHFSRPKPGRYFK